MENSRRDFLLKSAALALGTIASNLSFGKSISQSNFLEQDVVLPEGDLFKTESFKYPYDAFEPHIDKLTMEIHYSKHYFGYITNLNKAMEKLDPLILKGNNSLNNIFDNISKLPIAVRNNAGGLFNHFIYFGLLKPNGGGEPKGKLADAIKTTFGSFEEFKKQFAEAGMKRFGSGWAWLILNQGGKLVITSTANQDNPKMNLESIDAKGFPILALDVWEHAYYLKNQNRRADYINSWWNVIDWDVAEKNFLEAK